MYTQIQFCKQMEDLRTKIQKAMPALPKKENPGRSEFGSVRELVNYVIEEDEKAKKAKQASNSSGVK